MTNDPERGSLSRVRLTDLFGIWCRSERNDMDIKIDITPEAIERQIVDAIVKAGIGKRIETAVLASLSNYSFQRTVEEAATDAICNMVREQVLKDDDLRAKGLVCVGWNFIAGPVMLPRVDGARLVKEELTCKLKNG